MKKIFAALFFFFFVINISGCAGTHANPIPISQIGDDKMSCNAIIAEMNLMNQLAEQKSADGSGQVAKNTAAAITGVFLIIPLFFIDPNNHNSVEEQAARNRAVKLQMIGKDKGCFDVKPNPTDEKQNSAPVESTQK